MNEGTIKGMLVWGMNPAVSAPNLTQAYSALGKLEWLAAFDLWETDTRCSGSARRLTQRHQDRGFPLPRGGFPGEGRQRQ